MPDKKIVLLYNPKAGGFQKATTSINQLVAALERKNIAVQENQVIATTGCGDATRIARQAVLDQADMVVVCGGDGTINEAAQALIGTQTTLAILPSGTANVLAKEMRLPRSPEQLAQIIASGSSRKVSVGVAGKPDQSWQRYFLLMAGIGLDASIIEAVNPAQKKQWGIGSYLVAGLKTLAIWSVTPFTLHFNNHQSDATFAIVANAANYAAWFKIAPKSRMESDSLDVCIFNSHSRLVYLGYAFLSLFGAHTIIPDVIYQPINELLAESTNVTPVQLDGELVGHLPMRFTVIPQALRIVA